jgi:hypothetical protein
VARDSLGDSGRRPSAELTLSADALDAIARGVAERLNDRPGDEEWIGVADAAGHIGAKPQRIYDLVSQGAITPGRDGTRLVFQRSTLDAYLKA